MSINVDQSVGQLKEQLYEQTGIPVEGQKLIFKGIQLIRVEHGLVSTSCIWLLMFLGRNLQNNDETVSGSGLKEGSKLMLIGRKVPQLTPIKVQHIACNSNITRLIQPTTSS